VVITSDSQLIQNLSRIRVSPKLESIQSQRTCFDGQKIDQKVLVSEQTHQITESFINKSDEDFNESQSTNSEIWKTSVNDTSNSRKNCVIPVNDERLQCYSSMIEVINENSDLFKSYITYMTNSDKQLMWLTLSELMIEKGFNNMNPKVCSNYFSIWHSKYVQVI